MSFAGHAIPFAGGLRDENRQRVRTFGWDSAIWRGSFWRWVLNALRGEVTAALTEEGAIPGGVLVRIDKMVVAPEEGDEEKKGDWSQKNVELDWNRRDWRRARGGKDDVGEQGDTGQSKRTAYKFGVRPFGWRIQRLGKVALQNAVLH